MTRPYAAWASLLLAPLFFILHEWHRHYGAVDAADVLAAWAILAGCAILIAAILWVLLHRRADVAAAGLVITLLFFCFWGYFYERLSDALAPSLPPRALVVAPFWFFIGCFLLWCFARLAPAQRRRLLNFSALLFGTLALVDGGMTALKHLNGRRDFAALPEVTIKSSGWNFYLLLFDELASPEALRDMGYDPSGLESFLQSQGFHLFKGARSNYNQTVFSIASMLNGTYVPGRKNGELVSPQDYSTCLRWINQARVAEAFEKGGYRLENLSIFRLRDVHPRVGKPFFRTGITLLFSSTFYELVIKKKLWEMQKPNQTLRDPYYDPLHDQQAILKEISRIRSDGKKRFVYAHFMTPHRPFFFDTTGKLMSKEASSKITVANDPLYYRPAMKHAEGVIRQAIETVMQREKDRSVILLMGDHGYREEESQWADSSSFQGLAAVYFPDGNYTMFPHGITHVNVMRAAVAKTLHITLPLLPDSTVLLGPNTERPPIWW